MSKIYIITSFNFFTHIKSALIAAGPVETSEDYAKTILREPLRLQRIFERMLARGYQISLIIPDETRFTNLLNGRALVEHYFDIVYGKDRTFLNPVNILSFNPDENPTINSTTCKVKLIEQVLQRYNAQHPENMITPETMKQRVIIIDEDEAFLNHMQTLGVQTRSIEVYPAHHDLRALEEELGIILPKYDPDKINEINKAAVEHNKQKHDFQYGKERLEIERKLQTLIMREWQYKIERDLVALQLSVVEPWVDQLPTLAGLKKAISNYQQELNIIHEDSLRGFQGYLVSDRSHIFYNDKFIPMTKENIKRIMEDFKQHLTKWLAPYQHFSVNMTTNFKDLTLQLQQTFAKNDAVVESIMYEKSELTLPIAFQEEDLKIQSNFNKSLKQSLTDSSSAIKSASSDHPFLKTCEQGNTIEIQKHLPLFNKIDFINQTRNVNGENALHIACRLGNINLLLKLALLEANLNIPVQILSQDQNTFIYYHPLHWALKHQQHRIVRLLISYGADVNAQDSKYQSSVLHTAVYERNADAVQSLLKAGALIDKVHADYQSWTPLHYAASQGNVSLMKLMLEQYRAKPQQIQVSVKGMEGETALGVAVRWNQPRVAKLMMEYGIWMDTEELQYLKNLAAKPGSQHILTILESLLKHQLETLLLQPTQSSLSLTQPVTNLSLENTISTNPNNNNLPPSVNFTFFKEAMPVKDEGATSKEKVIEKESPRSLSSEDDVDHTGLEEVALDQPAPSPSKKPSL